MVSQRNIQGSSSAIPLEETLGDRDKHKVLASITTADMPPEDYGRNLPDPVYHARQARLLAAVKDHPQVLTRWMHELIVGQMDSHGWYDCDTVLMGGDIPFKDLLAPTIATLTEDDQEFFAECDQTGSFKDYIDLFPASFTVKEDAPVIVENGASNER